MSNFASTVGTKYTNAAITLEKARTLSRKNPALGQFVANTFGVPLQTDDAVDNKEMDRYTRNAIQTLFSVEIKNEEKLSQTLTAVAGDVEGLKNDVVHEIQGVKESLNEILKPISSATGATLGTLTNVVKDPFGAPFVIGESLASVVDKVNPGFANKLDASFKKFKSAEFQNMPAQVMGSIRNLASEVDALLSVPFALASDLYNGLMEIMQEVSDLIDGVATAVFDLFFGPQGILDSILPMDIINEALDVIGEATSMLGGITQQFSGLQFVNDITSQVTQFTSVADTYLSNPASLAQQYIPTEVTNTLQSLRNPQKMVDNLIPKSISDQLQKLSTMPGLGFVGNLGYGLGGTLNSLKQGVLTTALDTYTQQSGILKGLLNVSTDKQAIADTQQAHPPQINSATTNANIPTVQGVPVVLQPPKLVLPTKQSNESSSQPISKGQQNKNGSETINSGSKSFLNKFKL